MKANNISDLAPKRKSDFEKVLEFEKWIEKIQNQYRRKNKRMCNAYEIVIG